MGVEWNWPAGNAIYQLQLIIGWPRGLSINHFVENKPN